MNDPVVFPLDPIYGKESGCRLSNRQIFKNARHNREREKRIAKCWHCGYFNYCHNPAECAKETGKRRKHE